jgi:hypothetical protein
VEGAVRIRVYLPTACPDRAVFRALAGRSAPQDHSHRGTVAASSPSSNPPTKQNPIESHSGAREVATLQLIELHSMLASQTGSQ